MPPQTLWSVVFQVMRQLSHDVERPQEFCLAIPDRYRAHRLHIYHTTQLCNLCLS
jgi:hypothetical protein